jgi:cytosine/adenosine deaminase-related metal-dependent hydrolase
MARTLIKDALVLTMDDELGTLPTADVLIDGNGIAAVGPDLPTEADAEVIDGRERIVMRGFVDTHRHRRARRPRPQRAHRRRHRSRRRSQRAASADH